MAAMCPLAYTYLVMLVSKFVCHNSMFSFVLNQTFISLNEGNKQKHLLMY